MKLGVQYGAGTHVYKVPPVKLPYFLSVCHQVLEHTSHKSDDLPQLITTTELLFIFSLCMVRFSNLAFIFRLSSDSGFLPIPVECNSLT